jgi:hypothetical protein
MNTAIRWHDAEIETAGFFDLLGPKGQALDARAFGVLATREDASAMIDQDYLGGAEDSEWTAFFVESMVEFLVWSRAPAGQINAEDLDWLAGQVAHQPSPSMGALLFALVRELNDVPERLTVLAMRHARNRRAASH